MTGVKIGNKKNCYKNAENHRLWKTAAKIEEGDVFKK